MISDQFPDFSPVFEKLRAELAALRGEYADLLSEYAELSGPVRANLETLYMVHLGRLEYRIFSQQVAIRRVRREIALYQAAANSGERIDPETVERTVTAEFAEYTAQLKAKKAELQRADELYLAKKLSAEDSKALKELYHDLVKKLHPDLNPDLPPKAKEIWLRIVDAYKHGDWIELNILADMAYDLLVGRKVPGVEETDSLEALRRDLRSLKKKKRDLCARITDMKSHPPFSLMELLSDPDAVAQRKQELMALIRRNESWLNELEEMRDDLRKEVAGS